MCSTGQQVLQGICLPIWNRKPFSDPAHCSPSSGHTKQDNFSSPLSVCGKDPLRKA